MTAPGEDLLAWMDRAIRRFEETAQSAAMLQDDPENGWGIVDDSGYAVPSKRRAISPHIGITHEPQSAEHIVLNNPAAVLRRCAADRKLLELHKPVILRGGGGARYFETVKVCRSCEPSRQFPETSYPCPTVVVLAQSYGWTADQTSPSKGDQVT